MSDISKLATVKKQNSESSKTTLLKKIDISNKEDIKKRSKEKLRFSFKLFDRSHEAFNLGGVNSDWYLILLDTLQDLSTLTWTEVRNTRQAKYDPHPYTWKSCNYTFNFDPKSLEQFEAFQLRLDKSHGRIHGFLVGNIYYIYWLDPHHNMYDSVGYGGEKHFPTPPTTYEKLLEEKRTVEAENNRFKEEIKAYEELLEKCQE